MAQGRGKTSLDVDHIEKFYLTSCTDLSYELGEESDNETDPEGNITGSRSRSNSKASKAKSQNPKRSKNPKLRKGRKGHGLRPSGPSIIQSKVEFNETFSRVFEPPPEPLDNSWMYRRGVEGQGGLTSMLTSTTASVLIAGAILVGIYSIWQFV